jgi:hypothetical protein
MEILEAQEEIDPRPGRARGLRPAGVQAEAVPPGGKAPQRPDFLTDPRLQIAGPRAVNGQGEANGAETLPGEIIHARDKDTILISEPGMNMAVGEGFGGASFRGQRETEANDQQKASQSMHAKAFHPNSVDILPESILQDNDRAPDLGCAWFLSPGPAPSRLGHPKIIH